MSLSQALGESSKSNLKLDWSGIDSGVGDYSVWSTFGVAEQPSGFSNGTVTSPNISIIPTSTTIIPTTGMPWSGDGVYIGDPIRPPPVVIPGAERLVPFLPPPPSNAPVGNGMPFLLTIDGDTMGNIAISDSTVWVGSEHVFVYPVPNATQFINTMVGMRYTRAFFDNNLVSINRCRVFLEPNLIGFLTSVSDGVRVGALLNSTISENVTYDEYMRLIHGTLYQPAQPMVIVTTTGTGASLHPPVAVEEPKEPEPEHEEIGLSPRRVIEV